MIGTAVLPIGCAARIVIRIVPVELRIIEEELDALAMALLRQHLQRILLVRRALHDIPVGDFRIEHREAVVMARRDRDVFHPGSLGQRDPGLRVKFLGIEKQRQAIVFIHLQLAIVEDPFAIAEHAVHAPVNEHAEFHVLKFAAGLKVFRRRLVVGLSHEMLSSEAAS